MCVFAWPHAQVLALAPLRDQPRHLRRCRRPRIVHAPIEIMDGLHPVLKMGLPNAYLKGRKDLPALVDRLGDRRS
jgi:hypothetical protein